MPRPDFLRTIMEFQERFATEAACLEYLAASRWPDGFECPGCGSRRAWVLDRRHLWGCGDCHLQTSVTAGTVMHGTRIPLRLWFWAAYLVATHTPGISAVQLQRQLGISRYTPWVRASVKRGAIEIGLRLHWIELRKALREKLPRAGHATRRTEAGA